MRLLGILRRLIGRPTTQEPESATGQGRGDLGFGPAEAAAWLAAMESGKLDVPSDVHDSAAWDRYWLAQIEVGPMEQGFGDMMASDPKFLSDLERRGARTILCVGNGFSSESWALVIHGFDVTVLDVSTIPRAHFCAMVANPDHPIHKLSGVRVRDEASIAFDSAVPIDSEFSPPMHRAEGRLPRGGGSLTYVTGDLMNADLCPGPFDVLIERRTVQLFNPEEREAALDRLAARLAPQALLVSHQHYGGWKPEEPRSHFATEWAADRGFTIDWARDVDLQTRAARLLFTTG